MTSLVELALDVVGPVNPLLLRAAGSTLVPELLRIVADERLARRDSRGGGSAPIHAAHRLGELRVAAAIPVFYQVLRRRETPRWLRVVASCELKKWGADAIAPGVAALAHEHEWDIRSRIFRVLVEVGVRDGWLYAELLRALEVCPGAAAELLGEFGDARALPLLTEAWERCVVPFRRGEFGLIDTLIMLQMAIGELGGELPDYDESPRAPPEPTERS